jgi:hypothetical protein
VLAGAGKREVAYVAPKRRFFPLRKKNKSSTCGPVTAGEYPTTAVEALPELHVSGSFTPLNNDGRYVREGDAQGLYHLVLGKGQNAFVANGERTPPKMRGKGSKWLIGSKLKGLGGTSLLNANVDLEADAKTFGMNVWPESMRKDSSLQRCIV